MTDSLRQQLLADACQMARTGGELARGLIGRTAADRKPDRTVVTEADHAVQDLILTRVAERYPRHAVLAEETVRRPHRHRGAAEAEYCWVVDPIDGTRNFTRSLPVFATAVAVLRGGLPVAAAVYEPNLEQLYAASVGGGSTLNGRAVGVSREPPHHDTLIGVPSGRNQPTPPAVHDWLDRWNLRNLGSTALHMALVAAGSIDAAFCQECRVWDVAAGWLLIREAGGLCTDLAGGDLFPLDLSAAADRDLPFLAAGPSLHPRLLATLAP